MQRLLGMPLIFCSALVLGTVCPEVHAKTVDKSSNVNAVAMGNSVADEPDGVATASAEAGTRTYALILTGLGMVGLLGGRMRR
jgi:hypothetical protein